MFAETLKRIVDNCDGGIAAVVMGLDGIPVHGVVVLEGEDFALAERDPSVLFERLDDRSEIKRLLCRPEAGPEQQTGQRCRDEVPHLVPPMYHSPNAKVQRPARRREFEPREAQDRGPVDCNDLFGPVQFLIGPAQRIDR